MKTSDFEEKIQELVNWGGFGYLWLACLIGTLLFGLYPAPLSQMVQFAISVFSNV
ncbi:MAG: hypothetical protein U9N81_00265 [Bacillota bacterium]|nr:hypothetical protein [Bacillota bacterium]